MTPPRTPAAPPPTAPPDGPAARRRAVRALGDAALAAALATGDEAAWAEFDARFRPGLEAYVRRVGAPSAYWARCVDDVLADTAMRLSEGAPVPDHLRGYLVRAAYHALLNARRGDARREQRHAAAVAELALHGYAAGPGDPDGGHDADDAAEVAGAWGASPAVAAVVAAATRGLADADRRLLVWAAEQVPRRLMAEWAGESYETTRKRVQRLSARLRAAVWRHAASLLPAERAQFERVLRRAGHVPPDAPPAPLRGRAVRAAGPPPTPGRAARPAEDQP